MLFEEYEEVLSSELVLLALGLDGVVDVGVEPPPPLGRLLDDPLRVGLELRLSSEAPPVKTVSYKSSSAKSSYVNHDN